MALTNKIKAIANAIREKTSTTELMSLDEMPEAIASIETAGDAPDDSVFQFSGDCSELFKNIKWKFVSDAYADKFTFTDITNCESMFEQSTISSDKFTINVKDCKNFYFMFYEYNGTDCPKIRGTLGNSPDVNLGTDCGLQNVDDLFLPEMFEGKVTSRPEVCKFASWSRLKRIPEWWCVASRLPEDYTGSISTSTCIYTALLRHSSNVEEACNIPIWSTPSGFTTDMFNNYTDAFQLCNSLREVTFETNTDGTPKKANWSGQKIKLNNNHSSAEYPHDAAVRTLNSLPDTTEFLATAGGTNYIYMRRSCNLTEAEIAVAASKGWTVTLS